jgi:hypothetical protein
MTWFAAHILMGVRWKGRKQKRFPVWENIVLFRADSAEAAFAKAEKRGSADAGDDDGTFHWGGEPAAWVFLGVRKLTECVDDPADGVEVACQQMVFDSEHAIAQYTAGEPTVLQSDDPFHEPDIAPQPGEAKTKKRA